jgi:iron complex transport system substrate-binding protein
MSLTLRSHLLPRRGFLGGSAAVAAQMIMSPVAAAPARFPVSVEHAFGITVVPSQPKRIVCIGFGDDNAVLALGERPVAMARAGMFESGIAPWCEEKIYGERPILLDGSIFDYETVMGLVPDLIIGIFSALDDVSYARMSDIAPTVAYRSGPWKADWREQTLMTGQALGKASEAESLVAGTNAVLKGFSDRYPGLKGKSFTFGTHFAGSGNIVVYLPGETRVDWLIELGLRPAPGVLDLADANDGKMSVDLSMENLERVKADVLIMWYDKGVREDIESQPLFKLFSPVQDDRYFVFDDPVTIWSASWPSALSIPYAFPRFLADLEAIALRADKS